MNTEYTLSKIEIKPITGPWWTLTQFQNDLKPADKYYVQVVDRNGMKPTKWMFKIEEVSLGERGMQIGVGPVHTPRGDMMLELLSRRSIQSKRHTVSEDPERYYAEMWLSDTTGNKNRLLVRAEDAKAMPAWIKKLYLSKKDRWFLRSTMEPGTRRESICINIWKSDAHRELIELFFATRIWVLQEGFFFREPEAEDPNNRNNDNE
jgi:hypothetical protein